MNNLTQKKYNSFQESMQVVLPLNLGLVISADDSVRLLSHIIDNISIRRFVVGRNIRRSVRTMLKLLIYGYMNKTYSSRQIETLCKRDINFMWLLNGEKVPDHNTIARFRKNFPDEITDVFYQVVNALSEVREIDFENVFIDGTKLEANANRYSFVWKGANDKLMEKLFLKIEKYIERINLTYCMELVFERQKATEILENIRASLSQLVAFNSVKFVSGKGKHKTLLQKDYEICCDLLEKQTKYNAYNATFGNRRSFSKTDKDATFMRMKEDHMKNGQLKAAYNIQLAVNSGYIVGNMACSDRNDVNALIPFLKTLSRSLRKKFHNIVADAGYESEEAYGFLQEHGYTSYIKPQNYEKKKTKAFKQQIGRRENMSYDALNDIYICHNGRKLSPIYQGKKVTSSGYEQITTKYRCESCSNCLFKIKCTKAKREKELEVSKKFEALREQSFHNIISEKGIELRTNRSIQAEGAFAVLKEDYGFRRFMLRGIKNITTEVNLLSLAYNISKLHIKIQNSRLQTHLHQLE